MNSSVVVKSTAYRAVYVAPYVTFNPLKRNWVTSNHAVYVVKRNWVRVYG